MTLLIGIEILFDGVMLFFASSIMFREHKHVWLRSGLLMLIFSFFCVIARISFLSGTDASSFSFSNQGFEIVPADDLIMFSFLILIVMVTNSLWFRQNAIYTLFGTFAVFSLIIIVREVSVLFFYGLDFNDNIWKTILYRAFSALLLVALSLTPIIEWLKDKLDDGSFPIKLLIGNTFVFLCALISFFNFNAKQMADNLLIITGIICMLAIIDLLIGLYAQKHSAEQKRIRMVEQYIPVIEELITQVRARQHEFNNRLLAISAAAQTAETLEQAKVEIAVLTEGLQFEISEKNLLGCDSKIAAGMIFSKIKYAEMKKIVVVSEITASLKGKAIREIDVVEIIGILLDNAIEASNAGDTVYIRIENIDTGLSITVSNPNDMLTATDFVQMFRRGFSTKIENSGTRGHGLANVKNIVDRYHGKILTRNETTHEKNYVTIGVLFP